MACRGKKDMKVYNRERFLELPPGTIYAKGKPWVFDGLMVKGDTLPYDDWFYRGLIDIDASHSGEWSDRLGRMLIEGDSYPMNTAYGRDGIFDSEELFLVYEEADLNELISVLVAAIPKPKDI